MVTFWHCSFQRFGWHSRSLLLVAPRFVSNYFTATFWCFIQVSILLAPYLFGVHVCVCVGCSLYPQFRNKTPHLFHSVSYFLKSKMSQKETFQFIIFVDVLIYWFLYVPIHLVDNFSHSPDLVRKYTDVTPRSLEKKWFQSL